MKGLDREVDLPVFLDGNDLGLDPIVQMEMILHVANVVPVDLGDVDQADLAVLELEKRPVRGDALDDRFDDRPDLYVCDLGSFPKWRSGKGTIPPAP